jgi:hypothetical protein
MKTEETIDVETEHIIRKTHYLGASLLVATLLTLLMVWMNYK